MDRKVIVNQGGALFTEMTYNYKNQLGGLVKVIQYKAQDIEGTDSKAVVPVVQFEREFSHAALLSLADVKKYDETFLTQLPEQPTGSLEVSYHPVRYRYGTSGIADIRVNFGDDTKELTFVSSRHIREDCTSTTNALECNVCFIDRVLRGGSGGTNDIIFIDHSHIL